MKIFFIRHGETTGDVDNRYGGTYDDHLSEKGIEQSKNVAGVLKNKGIKIIFSSSLIRAQETSKILSQVFNCKIQTVPEFRERNQYSFLSGMTKQEAKEKYPMEVEMLKDRLNTIEGAESYEDFSKRIREAFELRVNNSQYNSIAIVSHGGPLRVLFRDILKWGELTEIGDCAYVELEKQGDTFKYIDAANFKGDFQIPVANK